MFSIGLLVAVGLLACVLKAQNYRWRLLASSYATGARHPGSAVKRFETVVAVGGGWAYTRYVPVNLEVRDDGLALRLVPPFSIYAPPLFLPFDEMTVQRTNWHLNSGSFTIKMTRNNGVDLIIDDTLLTWLQANSNKIPIQ